MSNLQGDIQIRAAANGYIVIYKSLEYVFLNVNAMNAWIAGLEK